MLFNAWVAVTLDVPPLVSMNLSVVACIIEYDNVLPFCSCSLLSLIQIRSGSFCDVSCCSLTFLLLIAISLALASFASNSVILGTDMLFASSLLQVLVLISCKFLDFPVKTLLPFPNFALVHCITENAGCLGVSSYSL